jgi:hypothetical protein
VVNRKAILLLLLLSLPLTLPGLSRAVSSDVSPTAQSEINHLLEYLETCGCDFCRNGAWYSDMKAVRSHAELKYRYFADKGRVHSAEDFIKWAGSRSEMSGKPYLVRCGNAPVVTASQWLTDELNRYRKGKSPPSPE